MSKTETEPGYRAVGTKKEGTVGTALAWGDAVPRLINFEDEITVPKPDRMLTDESERTGHQWVKRIERASEILDLTQTRKAVIHELTLFSALLFGSCSSAQQGATAAYLHTISVLDAILSPTTTLWEMSPLLGNKVFAGVGCHELEISVDKNDFVKYAAQLRAISMATGVDISGGTRMDGIPGSGLEQYLSYFETDILIDSTSIKEKIRTAKLRMKNGSAREYTFGSGSSNPTGYAMTNKKIQDYAQLELDMDPADATELNYYINDTELVDVQFLITGDVAAIGYDWEFSVTFPYAKVPDGVPGKDGTVQTNMLTIQAVKDDSANDDPIVEIYGQNLLTEYLQAV